jgi:hypothetical protein
MLCQKGHGVVVQFLQVGLGSFVAFLGAEFLEAFKLR